MKDVKFQVKAILPEMASGEHVYTVEDVLEFTPEELGLTPLQHFLLGQTEAAVIVSYDGEDYVEQVYIDISGKEYGTLTFQPDNVLLEQRINRYKGWE